MIRLLSLSCIIAIFLLSENNNIYSNIIPLWLQLFSKSFLGAEVQKRNSAKVRKFKG